MNEKVFKPKHNWFPILMWGFLFIFLGVAFSIGGLILQELMLTLLGLGILLIGVLSIASRPSKIIMRDTEVIVKYLLLPNRRYKYEDYSGFNGEAFLFGFRGIFLKDMMNSREFASMFTKFLDEKNVSPSTKRNDVIVRINSIFKRSVVPLILFSFIAEYAMNKYFDIKVGWEVIVSALLFFIIVGTTYYSIRKTKS